MKSSNKKFKLLSLESLGLVIVLISIIGLICLFAGKYVFGELGVFLRGFLFGVFGYLSYAIMLIATLFGVVSIAGYKLKVKLPIKTTIIAFIGLFSLVCILQLTFTKYTGSYGAYISKCYKSGFETPSIGGVLFALILGLVCSFLKTIGAYIIFGCILALVLTFFVFMFIKKVNVKVKVEGHGKKNKVVQEGVSLPFDFTNNTGFSQDAINLPFGYVNSYGAKVNNQPIYSSETISSQDAVNKLDALRRGVPYQETYSGDNISSYSQSGINTTYSNGVSSKISNNDDYNFNSSYQESYLDESTPSSKMFIPKEVNGDNPYTIKDTKVSVEEDKLQESSTVSAFDEILDKTSTSDNFDVEYKKAKLEQEEIFNETNFEDDSKFSTSAEEKDLTQGFTYSDPTPTQESELEQELPALTFESMKDYDFIPPPLSLFKSYEANEDKDKLNEFIDFSIDRIKEVIRVMKGYELEVKAIHHGPTFTRFDLEVPIGIPVKDIEGLADDMGLQLNANLQIRIMQVPNSNRIGIEVPNRERVQVGLKEILSEESFVNVDPTKCPFIVGKDVTGKSLFLELAELTHILLAGASGSGKSVFVTALLISLMCKVSPKDLRMIICDPKGVDFMSFAGAPHLLIDEIVVERPKIEKVLAWAVQEMERRYSILQENRATKIADYNKIMKGKDHMARILIFIDEFADLVSEDGKEIMAKVQRLAQKARAAGIHLLLATQRPTVNIVSGTIKSNLSTRIALKVQNNQDSRIILDEGGAENLLVHGDMMFFSQTNPQIQRAQGPNISSDELYDVLSFIREKNQCIFDERLKAKINAVPANSSGSFGGVSSDDDKDFDLKVKALKYVIECKKTSISSMQREFRIGFNKAASIHDWLIKEGYITDLENGKGQINITMDQFKAKFGGV